MIIFKDLSWQIRTDMPSQNWSSSPDVLYIVDDNSDLANKIRVAKNWVPVIENGTLVDIRVIEKDTDAITQLTERLVAIDFLQIRALVALRLNPDSETDMQYLKTYEYEKQELRRQLQALNAN